MSQILNPTLDAWQTFRFFVFAQHSHEDVDPHKELQETLTKLEEKKSSEDDDKSRSLSEKRKRKFLELAIPCGALSTLCFIYCLVYLSMAGADIASTTQWKSYQTSIGELENVIRILLGEFRTRILSHDVATVPGHVYARTDAAVNHIMSTKTLRDWRLINSLNDWRTQASVPRHTNVVGESLFYLNFISDLESVLLERGLKFDAIGRWKLYYDYHRTSKFSVALHVMTSVCEVSENVTQAGNLSNATLLEYFKLVSKFHLLLEEYDSHMNRSLSYTFVLISSLMDSLSGNNTDSFFFFEDEHLDVLKLYIHKQRIRQFNELKSSNADVFKMSVVSFCMSFLGLLVAVVCTAQFGVLLRKESRLVVLVADWFSHLESRVERQKESTRCVLNQVVPRTMINKYNTNQNMIPYQSSDTTVFMSSIAQFNSLFELFSVAQTLQILTFVMELLDERMAQYNVFPVSRMGHYLVVISDSTERRQVQHACEVANLALDIMTCCSDLEIGRHATSKLQMKIGIHSGACTGRLVIQNGTVQLKLLGSSIEILEHIHNAATPNMIHLSESAYKHLNTCDTYCLHYRGNISINGNCKYRVYWLNGRRVSSVTAFDRESTCSRMGSWIELEKKPLYRLDEEGGTYEPVNKAACKRYSQMSIGSYAPQISPTPTTRGQRMSTSYLGY